MIETSEKIRLLGKRKNISITRLAEMTEQSRQNLTAKMKKDSFKEDELRDIAKALGCTLEIKFIDNETKEEL